MAEKKPPVEERWAEIDTRICDECGKRLIIQRLGARFCGDECKNAWHNQHRRSQSTTRKRLAAAEGGVGTRGGSVRSVDEARQLQTASKALDRWRLVMEVQVHRTLLETGRFHVDDLDCLGLPPEAFEVRGTLVNAVRASGVMRSTGVSRKVAHKAANARKAPIYEITPKGREQLPKLVGSSSTALQGAGNAAAAGSDEKEIVGVADEARVAIPGDGLIGNSGDPGSHHTGAVDAGQVKDKSDQGRPSSQPSPAAGTGSPDSLIQLDGARRAPSMFDPWEGQAA